MQRKMIHRLLKWKQEQPRKPLLLKGMRQVGKTHLLKEFGKFHFSNTHYLNFEKQPGLAKIFEPDLVPKRILDELRECLQFKLSIKLPYSYWTRLSDLR